MRRFFLLELAISIQGWWLAPVQEVSAELDEIRYVNILIRFGAITIALEGLIAIEILQFLASHGQS